MRLSIDDDDSINSDGGKVRQGRRRVHSKRRQVEESEDEEMKCDSGKKGSPTKKRSGYASADEAGFPPDITKDQATTDLKKLKTTNQ